MPVLIENTNTLENYPVGTTISVAQEDGSEPVTYTKQDDGRWAAEGRPAVRTAAFAQTARERRLRSTQPLEVGQWLHNAYDDHYFKVLKASHGKYKYAEVYDSRLLNVVDDAVGVIREQQMPSRWEQAADSGMAQLGNSVAQERLDSILASGVIPEETEHTVKVRVYGYREVTPDHDQARALLGDEAEIRSSTETVIEWSKEYDISKTSRWECVCDSVTQEDIDALSTPGTVQRWEVLDCE